MRRKFVTVDVLHITRFYWRPARPDARSQRFENGSSGKSPVSSTMPRPCSCRSRAPRWAAQALPADSDDEAPATCLGGDQR